MSATTSPEDLFDVEYWDTTFECESCGSDFDIDTVVRIPRINYFPMYLCKGCATESEYRIPRSN